MSPQRVPITRSSSGVSPIEVSTATPPRTADAEAPLPRCNTIVFNLLGVGVQDLRHFAGHVLVRGSMEPVTANAVHFREIPVNCVRRRGVRQ